MNVIAVGKYSSWFFICNALSYTCSDSTHRATAVIALSTKFIHRQVQPYHDIFDNGSEGISSD